MVPSSGNSGRSIPVEAVTNGAMTLNQLISRLLGDRDRTGTPSSLHRVMSGPGGLRLPGSPVQAGRSECLSQEAGHLRVIPDVNFTPSPPPFPPTGAGDHDRSGQLVSTVVVAFVQGDLKPGDPLPGPSELARAFHIPRHEVVKAVGYLLSHRILEQDRSGSLRIHRGAAPTIEMKQCAFLARARQLVGDARHWHLPADCLDPLFHKAAHEEPCGQQRSRPWRAPTDIGGQGLPRAGLTGLGDLARKRVGFRQ